MPFFKRTAVVASAAALSLALAACSGGGNAASTKESDALKNQDAVKEKVELTMAGWNLESAPEFQALADAFHEKNPNVTITVKPYSAKDYDTLMTTDLKGGKAPDLIPIKSMLRYPYYTSNNTMANVTSIGEEIAKDKNINMSYFKLDDKYYAVPFRQDIEVVYYNKDLFKKAGVPEPDGKWTWDDYIKIGKQLTDKLGPETKGVYSHYWPIYLSLAATQTPGADVLTGDLGFFKKYFEHALQLQKDGSTVSFGEAQTKNLTYQAQFNKQKAAMMPMGTWYIAMLLEAQAKGDADKFEWGVAPMPQYDSSTFDAPVTYGASTPLSINAAIKDEKKMQAAGNFLRFIGSEEGGQALAKRAVFPAYLSDTVLDTFLANKGMPSDDLTRFALQKQVRKQDFPIDSKALERGDVFGKLNSAIMTEAQTIDEAIKNAEETFKTKGLTAQK